MICFLCLVALAFPLLSQGVKVNMQGSVSLGKDVVETISHYVQRKLSGRRSYSSDNGITSDADTVALIVNSAFLCRDLPVCQGELSKSINKYIIMLTKSVESVFEGLFQEETGTGDAPKSIFEEELKILINEVKKLLRNANEKINDQNEAYIWVDMVKKINAKFQDRAIMFGLHRLEGNVKDISEVKKKLTQKIVIVTILVELKFERKLCLDHKICVESLECTKSLNTVLEHIRTVPEDRAKQFVRYFYEALPDTNFYYRISDVTANEFQSILNDMSYVENIPTKNVLSIVQKTVEGRLKANTTQVDAASGRDVELAHVILSDMDHFYSKHKKEPFLDFLSDFFEWSKTGGKFSSPIRRVLKDISNMLYFESDELVMKLVNEVRVFMEITVDPEK